MCSRSTNEEEHIGLVVCTSEEEHVVIVVVLVHIVVDKYSMLAQLLGVHSQL